MHNNKASFYYGRNWFLSYYYFISVENLYGGFCTSAVEDRRDQKKVICKSEDTLSFGPANRLNCDMHRENQEGKVERRRAHGTSLIPVVFPHYLIGSVSSF